MRIENFRASQIYLKEKEEEIEGEISKLKLKKIQKDEKNNYNSLNFSIYNALDKIYEKKNIEIDSNADYNFHENMLNHQNNLETLNN